MKNNILQTKSLKSTKKLSKGKRIALGVFIAIIVIPALALASCLAGYAIWASGMHIDRSLLPTASALPAFYDSQGQKVRATEDSYVAEGEAPEHLKNAFVAIEDKRFYSHKGYDLVRIGGAILKNVKAGYAKEGASTITQQLVKNTHLSSERSLSRKLKEIALARDLEKKYSKDEILNMYMSVIYFGSGAYGVKSAAQTFFGKEIGDLTLAQSATLASIVRNPAGYSPFAHPEKCLERRDLTLSLMLSQGLISQEQYDVAKAEPLGAIKRGEAAKNNAYDLYVALAKKEAAKMLGMTTYELDNSGAQIYMNMDRRIQDMLEQEMKNGENFENDGIMASAIVADNRTGEILGASGTCGYDISRQTGSVLKPLAVYAPALDMHAVSLATPIVDEKTDFAGFSPENFNDKYYGETCVEESLKKSMNSASVKLLDYLGLENSVSYLKKMGFDVKDRDKNYSLALGSLSASPLDIACAYSAFARGGEYSREGFVKFVVLDGQKILPNASSHKVFSKATASLITSALVQTVKDGTAKTLSSLPFEVAAKTGTVERKDGKNSDGWIASYNDDITVAVWHGSDDGMSERGGGFPAMHAKNIWKNLAENVNFSAHIAISDDVIPLEIDEYSTKALKKVVLANGNTPAKFKKTQYFDASYLPAEMSGMFDAVSQGAFEINIAGGRVRISFDTRDIYAYELYRTDIFGKALILSTDGTGDGMTAFDMPISFGKTVDYELASYVKGNPSVRTTSTKSIFFDAGYPVSA